MAFKAMLLHVNLISNNLKIIKLEAFNFYIPQMSPSLWCFLFILFNGSMFVLMSWLQSLNV